MKAQTTKIKDKKNKEESKGKRRWYEMGASTNNQTMAEKQTGDKILKKCKKGKRFFILYSAFS